MRLYLLSTGLSAMLRENRLVSRELALTPIPRQGANMRHAERVCSIFRGLRRLDQTPIDYRPLLTCQLRLLLTATGCYWLLL